MAKFQRFAATLLLAVSVSGCSEDYLTTQPQTILTDETVWGDPARVLGVVSNYYSRMPQVLGLQQGQYEDMAAYDEALWSSGTGWENRNQMLNYGYNRWTLWDNSRGGSSYGLIRDMNLAIDNINASSMPPATKQQFIAEIRFIRAYTYFEHVKRMGGVPIITEQLIYDFDGDPSDLQRPRNTEAEVYDFVASELDAIMDHLGNTGSKTRANKYIALALKSRAMLYAGSLARYNNQMPVPITLPGGEVGIPASRANEYFQKSLDASRAILQSGVYSLYNTNPNKGENFYEVLTKKSGNNEVIFARDYSTGVGLSHLFTLQTIPRSQRLESPNGFGGAALSPSLQLVEAFDYLDNSPGVLKGVCLIPSGGGACTNQASWTYYNDVDDIFEGKDPRLYGTVIYPGTSFAGKPIHLQAGVYEWNPSTSRYDRKVGTRQTTYTDGGVWVGEDGPVASDPYTSATGFLLRKYLDTAPAAPTSAVGSDVWWSFFRLGEIYLNAAEAALELGLEPEARGYVNTLRQRAGFPANSLATVDMARIRNERRVELAFEDHRVWDLIRWRLADQLWNGITNDPNAHVFVLFPYRLVGGPQAGKFVFDKSPSTRQTAPRFFRPGNYYSQIPGSVVDNNPLVVRNPFH